MTIKCADCGSRFFNYDSWHDDSEIHPKTGTTPLVLDCPECGAEQRREYHEIDPRHE